MTGKVSLIGGGPGDPDLITVKGLKLLRQADVVVYDLLVAQELLHEVREGAELLDAGKTRERDKMTQDEINAVLVDRARQGLHVVRLKGGDPYVYGRGGEEAVYCLEHGVPCEVVPGVSSLLAATSAAGIPLTYYGLSSRFLTLTGYENKAKPAFTYDYNSFVNLNATLVFFMTRFQDLENFMRQLLEAGYDPEMPAAVIHKGAMPDQEVLVTTAASLTEAVLERWGDTPLPSLIVLGKAVTMRDKLPHLNPTT